jgi:hypothetical protein
MSKFKLFFPILVIALLFTTSCGKKKETYTCHCFTTINNNLGTFLSESDIQVEATKGEGAEACAKQNKNSNDGNGNSEVVQCTLK